RQCRGCETFEPENSRWSPSPRVRVARETRAIAPPEVQAPKSEFVAQKYLAHHEHGRVPCSILCALRVYNPPSRGDTPPECAQRFRTASSRERLNVFARSANS